ncbi:CRISPR-associated protein, family [Nitritalea halalkaliphila LW7]|uniref:CRISPR-associated protein, family n=1 Tax=Nitritalea halalkaliphila LW7 TaxID=1189621 RepID=I5BY67_9BACT|nr:CRISPR-associated protein, family [Nitritalea halalkaliphila]EIM74519.1 CRISPR-associated protein, family [Nitritalea halalkaliphila LW7]
MITALYKFSKLLQNDPDLQIYFSTSENPFDGREELGKIIVGEVENKQFKGFHLEDFNPSSVPKYLYRKPAGANGTNIVPTLFINKQNPEKTWRKISKSLLNLKPRIVQESEIEKISTEFSKLEFNSDFSYLITFKLDGKFMGEFESYTRLFSNEAYIKYFKKKNKNSKKENKTCALTGKISTVFGFVDTLGFTVDADSFMRNGFNASDAYKMFPISESAIPILEAGRGILLNQVAANFFGQYKYAIIPNFIFLEDQELGEMVASTFLNKAAFNADSKVKGVAAFINDSESLLDEIVNSDQLKRSDIQYSILFFEQQQAQFKIHLEISDVLPSRISKILESKTIAEEKYKWLTYYKTKDGTIITHNITLFRLREYFLTSDKVLQPSYFKLLSSIFTGQKFNDLKLLSLILNTWKLNYKKYFHDEEKSVCFICETSFS